MTMNQRPIHHPRLLYQRNIKSGSSNLLIFSIFTIINIILIFIDANLSFLFSAYIPQFMIAIGRAFADTTGSNGLLIVFSVIAGLYVIGCILSAVLANKKTEWLILGAVLVTLDTVLMLIDILPSIAAFLADDTVSLVILLLFHAWILYYIVNALVSYKKLKMLPTEPQFFEATYTVNGVAPTNDTK